MTLHKPCSLVPPIAIVFAPLAIVPPGKIGVRIHQIELTYDPANTRSNYTRRYNCAFESRAFLNLPWPGFCGAYVATISVRCKSCLVHMAVIFGPVKLSA